MAAFSFPFPVLVCDTGGTNVRFALSPTPGAALGAIVHLITDDYPGLPEAIEAAAPKLGARPRSMIVCGAGPVVGRQLKLTNAPWIMDGPETARRCGISQGLLLNDFEAQALSLPAIQADWTRPIGQGVFGAQGPQVILGPGTGLGIAALVEAEGRFTPVSSEACHIDFGPVTTEEFALWPHLERAHGRITSESVLNGAGLARVHRARMMGLGRPDPRVEPPEVTAAAIADPKGEVAESVRLYWRIMARFAGDMAVTFVATGGVTLSGGVLPRVVDFLDDAGFRAAFEAKAPVDALARRIPTRLIVRSDAVLSGMAAIAAAPDRYGIDYSSRGWV
jgi:glucokinase